LDGERLQSAEVVNVANDGKTCPSIPDYPFPVEQITAAYYRGKVVACGGRGDDGYTSECYELSSDLDEWISIQSLPTMEKSTAMRSSVIDDKWVLTGAGAEDLDVYVYDNGLFSPGIPLPEDHEYHCQLTLDDEYIFLGGNFLSSATYLLNWRTQEYIPLEEAPWALFYPACGLLNNAFNGPEILVASGDDAFIFSLTDLTWRDASDLPLRVHSIEGVKVDGGVLALGGEVNYGETTLDTIYKFEEETYEWTLLDQTLETPRYYAGVVAVPDEFVNCQ